MRCKRNTKDPLLQKLVVSRGANLIVPPVMDLTPGVLVLRDLKTNAMRPADWAAVFGLQPEVQIEDDGERTFEGFGSSADMSVSTGGSILGDLLGFGASKDSVTVAIEATGASKVRFGLFRSSYTALANLDGILTLLRDAGASPAETYLGRRVYVVTKSWWAEGVTMDLMYDTGHNIDLSAKAIDQLEGSLHLNHKSLKAGNECFFAEEPKIFAVTMRELKFEGGLVRDIAQEDYLSKRSGDEDVHTVFSVVDEEDIIFDISSRDDTIA